MDGISMKGNIMDIDFDTSHILDIKFIFFGGPLEVLRIRRRVISNKTSCKEEDE
jgi:hypothetical protein